MNTLVNLYSIIGGFGEIRSKHTQPTLLAAARTAVKMLDQGGVDVEIFDPAGKPISRETWQEVWSEWAASTRPSDIGL